jgi:hypothetical protein
LFIVAQSLFQVKLVSSKAGLTLSRMLGGDRFIPAFLGKCAAMAADLVPGVGLGLRAGIDNT